MKRFYKITRFLSLFLCLTIAFNAVVAPYAHAAEVEQVEEDYSLAPASLTGTLTLGSAGTGAIASGSAAIVSGALPALMFILTGGLLINELGELAKATNEFFSLLSATVREELSNLDLSGETITLSPTAVNEMTALANEYFYNDDGTLASAGVTLDSSDMLTYNYGAQYVASNDPPSTSYYDTTLRVGSLGVIGSTGIRAGLFESPFSDGGLALKVQNPSTGRVLTFSTSTMSKLADCGSRTYSISHPVIVNNEMGEFGTMVTAGFWILAHCSDENCIEHYRYNSYFIGDDNSVSKTNQMIWEGVDLWDSFIFTHQIFDYSVGMWKRVLETPYDGTSWVYRKNPGMVDVLADEVVDVFRDTSQTFPLATDVLYLPTADVLADVNTMTPEYLRTGVVDGVIDTPTVDTPTTDQTGFWNTLWGWLQDILDAILGLPAKIWQLLQSGFADVVNAIKELKAYLSEILQGILDLPDAIAEKFGNKEYDKTIIDLLKEFFDGAWEMITGFLDMIGITDLVGYMADFFDNIGDYFTHDDQEDVNSFFEFMRRLWGVIPSGITSFIGYAFVLMLVIAVIKIFK